MHGAFPASRKQVFLLRRGRGAEFSDQGSAAQIGQLQVRSEIVDF
jgi:hypothetical protein